MNAPAPTFADDRMRQEALIAHLAAVGYVRCEPPILQPASAFFDSGEDMRGRLYHTSDMSGADYCLRPEYTIPVCLHYLGLKDLTLPASYSYCGPVFRFRKDGPAEFIQAGIENLGRADREAADAEILAIALEAARFVQGADLATTIGDVALFSDLLDATALSPQWRRRIMRGLAQGKALTAILDAVPQGGEAHDHSGVLAALEGVDKTGARALVEDLLSIAGIATVGGRSANEIAERFLEQAALKGKSGLPQETRAVIERFVAIEGDPDAASADLRDLAEDAGLDLEPALERFDSRLGFIAARGIAIHELRFSTRFLRNLDYYTGFIFEAHDTARPDGAPLVGGGRYDRLLKTLGAKDDVPAVGAAIGIDKSAGEAA